MPAINQNYDLLTFKGKLNYVYQILKEHWLNIAVYLLAYVAYGFINAIFPYFAKLEIDQLAEKQQWLGFSPLHTLFLIVIIPALISFFRSLIISPFDYKNLDSLNIKLRVSSEKNIWDKLHELDAGFFMNQKNQQLFSMILGSSDVAKRFLEFIKFRISAISNLVLVIPILLIIDWRLFVLLLVAAITQLIINEIMRQKTIGYSLLEDQVRSKYIAILDSVEKYFYQLKCLGVSQPLITKMYQQRNKMDLLDQERNIDNERLSAIRSLLDEIAFIAVKIFVAVQVFRGQISLGTFTIIVAYTQNIRSFLAEMLGTVSQWREIDLDFVKLNFLLNLKSRLKLIQQTKKLPSLSKQVSLEQVNFRYPNYYEEEQAYLKLMMSKIKTYIKKTKDNYHERDISLIEQVLEEKSLNREILSNVSLSIKQGQITALVGRNGAGKTTITHLIQHHFEPDQGKVLLNNDEIYHFDHQQLVHQFSWLQQQPFILERFSILDNLLLGVDTSKQSIKQEMQFILAELGLDQLIASLPKKERTILGEETNLSGGQQQLLAIARAMLQKRPFLILDEGSSQLDAEKEFGVLKLLQRIKEDCAILFITHRMSVARKADYIYVVDQGQIIEEGKHSELLQSQGLYNKFWQMQVID